MSHFACWSAGLLVLSSFMIGCGDPSHSPRTTGGPVRGSSASSPSITALSPNRAPVNSVPFTMEVDGANFTPGATVFWNGTPLFTTFLNSQQVLAYLAAPNLMLPGMIHVYVRTSGQNSNTVEFDLNQ
jgi:hypothetical protein